MSFAEYTQEIEAGILPLTRNEKVAVCLVCCTRLSPLYQAFVQHEQWGDERPFAQCRKEADDFLRGKIQLLSVTTSMLDPLIPNTEDYGSLHGSFALNAGCAHLDLVRQSVSDGSDRVIDALLMCYETIDFCVQRELDPHYTRSVALSEIGAHEMMVREIGLQRQCLRCVRGHADLASFAMHDCDDPILDRFMLDSLAND